MDCRNSECVVGGEVYVGCLDSNGKYFVYCPDCYIQGPLRNTNAEAVQAYRDGVDVKERETDRMSFYVEDVVE